MWTIWRRAKGKAPWRLLAADTDEKRIRARYQSMRAVYKAGELKLALDLAVVQRDTVERATVGV
jgi:hypothetical protein